MLRVTALSKGSNEQGKRRLYWPIFGDVCHIMMGNLVSVSVETFSLLYLSLVFFLTRPGCRFTFLLDLSYLLGLDVMRKLLSGCSFS